MLIFVGLWIDPHADAVVKLFVSEADAMAWARKTAGACGAKPLPSLGRLYLAAYGIGAYIYVESVFCHGVREAGQEVSA